ncbi:MAG: hypothetical protein R6V47_05665, partial [Candidatus Delongbacteria bacterium]
MQGSLMLLAVTIVPVLAFFAIGGSETIAASAVANGISASAPARTNDR